MPTCPRTPLRAMLLATTALVLPLAAPAQTLIDGHGGPGQRITGTATRTDEIHTNYVTRGGDGSGGGAGLGGVFFVDDGASLTLNGVSFNTNTAIGGDGGSTPALRFGPVTVGLVENRISAIEVSELSARPILDAGQLTFGQIAIGATNPLLKPGMTLRIDGVDDPVTIGSVSGTLITLAQSATVSGAAAPTFSPDATAAIGASALSVADVGDLKVGATLRGAGIAEGTTITAITYGAGTEATLTLSTPLTAQVNAGAPLTAVLVSGFEASNVAQASGATITLASPSRGCRSA